MREIEKGRKGKGKKKKAHNETTKQGKNHFWNQKSSKSVEEKKREKQGVFVPLVCLFQTTCDSFWASSSRTKIEDKKRVRKRKKAGERLYTKRKVIQFNKSQNTQRRKGQTVPFCTQKQHQKKEDREEKDEELKRKINNNKMERTNKTKQNTAKKGARQTQMEHTIGERERE